MRGRVPLGAIGRTRHDEAENAFAPGQAIDKTMVRFIQLKRLSAYRIPAVVEPQLEVERSPHGRAAPLPLGQQYPQDFGHALTHEDAHVPTHAHQGHGVDDRQPVAGEGSIECAGVYVRDNAVDRMQCAVIRRDFNRHRQPEQFVMRQVGALRQANHLGRKAGADTLLDVRILRHQRLRGFGCGTAKIQAHGAVVLGKDARPFV